MFCVKCGKQLPDDANFCNYCGAAIAKIPTDEETVSQDPIAKAVEEEPKAAPIPEVPAEPEEKPQEQTEAAAESTPQPKENKPKKKHKKAFWIGIAAAAVLLVAIVVVCALVLGGNDRVSRALPALIDADGVAYVNYGDGKVIKLSGDVSNASISPDRSKIVVLEKEGDLYWQDVKKDKKQIIVEFDKNETVTVESVGDRFVLYAIERKLNDGNSSKEFFRYNYKENKSVSGAKLDITKDNALTLFGRAGHSVITGDTAFIFRKNKTVNLLAPDSDEPITLTSADSTSFVDNLGVSDDGKTAIWTEAKAGKYTLVLWMNGEKEILFTDDAEPLSITSSNYSEYLTIYLEETYDKAKHTDILAYETSLLDTWKQDLTTSSYASLVDLCVANLTSYFAGRGEAPDFVLNCDPYSDVVVVNGANHSVFVKDGEVESMKLSSDVVSHVICTTNGTLLEDEKNAKKLEGYYVKVEEDPDTDGTPLISLYLVTFKNGERNKILSKVRNVSVIGDSLIYETRNGTLNHASVNVKEATLENERRIGVDIDRWYASETHTDYVYLLKNYSAADNTYSLFVYDYKKDDSFKIAGGVSGDIKVSDDSKKVYYFTDVSTDSDSNISHGTLKVYNAKKEESVKIMNDVVLHTVGSEYYSTDINPKSLWFERYQGSEKNGYICDIVYFDGDKTEIAISRMPRS